MMKFHNPLNLRPLPNGQKWQGELENIKCENGLFCTFVDDKMGYRAGFRNLHAYFVSGIKTVKQVISAWSPEADPNNPAGSTQSYIKYMCNNTGLEEDFDLSMADKDTLINWALTQSHFENDSHEFPLINKSDIERGLELAFNLPH